jgi:DNA-directed RNA polymerase subunit M/transcription elongation factor TFIIS
MKGSCPKCGAPLKKGNIKVVRKPGKRPVRVCRKCQPVQSHSEAIRPNVSEAIQRAQDGQGGARSVEVVYQAEDAPKYRYFMTQDQAERVRRALTRQISAFGIGFEVIPVPEDQVDADPGVFADLVEITVNWKTE